MNRDEKNAFAARLQADGQAMKEEARHRAGFRVPPDHPTSRRFYTTYFDFALSMLDSEDDDAEVQAACERIMSYARRGT